MMEFSANWTALNPEQIENQTWCIFTRNNIVNSVEKKKTCSFSIEWTAFVNARSLVINSEIIVNSTQYINI